KLSDYPPPDAATQRIDLTNAAIAAAFTTAQTERQAFAKQIYDRLVLVTGAKDPNDPANMGMIQAADEYAAARWLAQLAVNIVDYVDYDDYMTPFEWNAGDTTMGNAKEVVFGTELPRLVLDEAYAQYDNDPAALDVTDPMNPKATAYRLN